MNPTNKTSGDVGVGTTTLMSGQAIVDGINIVAAAADVTVTLYDNTAGSGTIVAKYILDISVEGLATYVPLPSVKCTTGLTAVVSGTGAEAIVHYR